MAILGELFRVTWQAVGPAGLAEQVWHVRGLATTDTAADIATALHTWRSNYKQALPSDYTLVQIAVQALTPFPLLTEVAVVAEAGTAAAGSNSQLAGIITWRTPLAGGSYRGRSFFVPAFDWLGTAGNILSTTGVTRLTNLGNAVLTDLVDGGTRHCAMGVYSRKIGGGGPVYNTTGWSQVTSMSVTGVLGAQRRRRAGRGA